MTNDLKPRGAARPPEDPAGAALRGPHRDLAVGGEGPVVRYRPDISPFGSIGSDPGDATWRALSALPGDVCAVFVQSLPARTPGWRVARDMPLLQMTGPAEPGPLGPDDTAPAVAPLSRADVPDMLDLTARTQPGPFLVDTIAFGGYVGIRRDGTLAAMAGRRLNTSGWIEVSAVCTDPAHRHLGLAQKVTAAVAAGIRTDGARPFLHVFATNPARRLYAAMGFEVARETRVILLERD